MEDFLSSVSLAYSEFDSDLKHSEGILEISMRELFIANQELRSRAEESENEAESLRNEIGNIVDNINEVVFKTDLLGNWVYLNSAWKKLTGLNVEQSLGTFSLDLLNSNHANEINSDFTTLLKSPNSEYNKIVKYRDSLNEEKWLSIKAKADRRSDGWILGLIGTITDITEKYKAEQKVKWLATVVEKTKNTVIISDSQQRITWVNRAFEELTGYTSEEVIGKNPGHFLQGDQTDKATIRDIHEKIVSKQNYRGTILNFAKNGNPYWVQMAIDPLFDSKDGLEGYIAIESDVTEEIKAKNELIRSEALLKAVLNSIPDYIWAIDENYKVTFANNATKRDLKEIYGVDIEVGKDMRNLYGSKDQDRWEEFLKSSLTNDFKRERIVRVMGDRKRFFDVYFHPVLELNTKTGVVLYIRDITDEIKAQLNLEEKTDQLQKAQILADLGSWVFDGKSMISCSEKMMEWLDLPSEQISYTEFTNAIDPDSNTGILDFLLNEGLEEFTTEHEFEAKTGSSRILRTMARRSQSQTSNRFVVRGVSLDITQQEKVRSQLKEHASELQSTNAELNQFAYAVSHDLKSPVRAVYNLAQFILQDLSKGEEHIKPKVEMLIQRAQFMEQLIDGILNYSRAGRKKYSISSINTRQLIRQLLESVDLEKETAVSIQGKWPIMEGEEIPFIQVFSNLLSNAVKYGKAKERGIVVHSLEDRMPEFAHFNIQDFGDGIEKQYQEKIFDIFQTLDESSNGKGTGIGLALVKKIIADKGGEIWVESDINTGSNFHFTWPIINKRVDNENQ